MGINGEWWFTSWQIPRVWAAGARGQGITVAVIDTGVQASFPELRGVVLPGTDFHGGDGRTDADLTHRGHGTSMAIDIAGQGGPSGLVGIAPEAKILPVLHEGKLQTMIEWSIAHGARVINLSWGSWGACLPEDQKAVRFALDHGAVVVSSSGNEGHHGDDSEPANCPGVVAVGATDYRMQLWDRSNQGAYVGVTAPGVHLPSLNLARLKGTSDGTSDAAALTSGVIALIWSKYPKLTNRQVVARMLATVRDLGPAGKDDGYGYGLVRPYQAITADVPANAPNPIFDAAAAAAASVTPTSGDVATGKAGSTSTTAVGTGTLVLLLVGAGIVGLVVVVLLMVLLVLRGSSRRRRQQSMTGPPGPAGGPPNAPSGWPGSPPTGPGGWPGSPPTHSRERPPSG